MISADILEPVETSHLETFDPLNFSIGKMKAPQRFHGQDTKSNSWNLKGSVRTETGRGGFTILELIGTCMILGAVFSLTVPLVLLIARERKTAEQQQFAAQHAANLLEIAAARPGSELRTGELKLPDADADLVAILPDLEQKILVRDADKTIGSRQLTAMVRWKNQHGQFGSPIQISAWVITEETP